MNLNFTMHLGRRTLIFGHARQTWLGGKVVRSSYRGTSCLMFRLLGFYAVWTAVPNPLRLVTGAKPRILFEAMPNTDPDALAYDRYPDPEQQGA